jgi:PAS domain-containing protein
MENKPDRVKTVAVYAQGNIVDNLEYDLTNTPCKNVVGQSPSSVQRLFPLDDLLADMKVEGYAGTPLFDSKGQALGLMVVLCSRPIGNPRLAKSILKIFAVRAGAELERRQAEERLRTSEARWRRVFENSAIGIALTDSRRALLDCECGLSGDARLQRGRVARAPLARCHPRGGPQEQLSPV